MTGSKVPLDTTPADRIPVIEARLRSSLLFPPLAVIALVLSGCGGGSTSTGVATLSWTPPTSRADESPIGELIGYRFLSGQSPGRYDRIEEIGNPGITMYLIDDLAPGTWYFAIHSMTSDGLVSAPSEEVSKSI